MQLKKLGVDFDDVLVPTNEHMCIWHNRVYGTSYQVKDVITYDLQHLWGCSDDEVLQRIHKFHATQDHALMQPVELAPDAIEYLLCQGIESTIVTSRELSQREFTMQLVRKHFPLLQDQICFSASEVDGKIVRKSKKQICQELGIDYFVEDSLGHVYSVAELSIPILLFDRPWNQTADLPKNVTRVYSWDEIVMKLM